MLIANLFFSATQYMLLYFIENQYFNFFNFSLKKRLKYNKKKASIETFCMVII